VAQRGEGTKDGISRCLRVVHRGDAAPKQYVSVFAQPSAAAVVPSFFSSRDHAPSKGRAPSLQPSVSALDGGAEQ